MGQPITVVEKASSNPAIIRFETNRPLSGLGHERYTEPPGELLDRPVDELARRLFAHGGVQAVHINSSMVTVTLAGGSTGAGLADVIRRLFLHYTDAPAAAAPVEPSPAAVDEGSQAPEATADPGDTGAAEEAEEPAAAPPAAPEAAVVPDAATTEPGAAPSQVEPEEQARPPEDDTSLAPPLEPAPDDAPSRDDS